MIIETQMVIVTGPNQELAIKLIKRMKALFEPLGITFDSKETVLELNGCSIEAYPSNHIDAFRSLTNPKFILLDEADFFRKSEQEDVRHVSERYIAKSDPFIVMVSTPYAPDGFNKYKMDLTTNGVVITDAIKFVQTNKEKLISVKEGRNRKESNELDEDKDQLGEEQGSKRNGQKTMNQVF